MDAKRERLYQARRAGLRERLVAQDRIPRDRAEQLVAAWESEAAARGLAQDDPLRWRDAHGWAVDQARGRRP